jgi:hypothetical protein
METNHTWGRRSYNDRRKNRFDRRKTGQIRICDNREGERRRQGEKRHDWIRFCPYISQYSPKIVASVFQMVMGAEEVHRNYSWVIENGHYI